MPKLSEIFDTPEATSRVRGNEKLKLEFIQKWDSGQFEWNHHEGDELGIKPNSLWRVWNEFIEPALTTKDQEKEEAVKEAYEAGRKSFLKDIHKIDHSLRGRKINYIIFDEVGTVDWDKLVEALPIEDNK